MKFSTKHGTLLLFLACCLGTATAQRTITGTVTDASNGEALIGANVVVKEEPSRGTVTDVDGHFSITVGADGKTLLVSYTGFDLVEQSIVGVSNVDVKMGDSKALQEVLVIGYGTVKREDATGLVQSVTADRFNKGAVVSAQQLISGKLAGVVVTPDGGPGGVGNIRIRGESSLDAVKEPLFVVDGVPLDNANVSGSRGAPGPGKLRGLSFLNPNDIESITVLKDASSAAIYGNRASAGVVIITTKKGDLSRKLAVTYNGKLAVSKVAKRVDYLTADEYRKVLNDRYPDPGANNPVNLLGSANTDWQDQIYQPGGLYEHNINLSGGIWRMPYRISGGHLFQDGLLKTDNFKRWTTGINLRPQFLNNRLQFNLNFQQIYSTNRFGNRDAIGAAGYHDPTQPVYDSNSKYGGYWTWTIPNGNPNVLAPRNPVALLYLKDDRSKNWEYLANASVDYRFRLFPALRYNLTVGRDHRHGEGTVLVPNYAAFAFDAINGGGTDNHYEQTRNNDVLETYLNYKKALGDHSFDVMGGYSWQHIDLAKDIDSRSNWANTPIASITYTLSRPKELYLVSVYGRANYSWNDLVFLTGSLRRDGTSRFAPDYRWGVFPAAALGLKLIDKNRPTFNFLKLRGSWGRTGQQDLGEDYYYAYLAKYVTSTGGAAYQFGNEFVQTLRPDPYLANIKWEQADSYNGGVDFSIVKDRLSGSADVYLRKTKDLLQNVPYPALGNLSNFFYKNIGTMESKGVEGSLSLTPVKAREFTWEITANVAYNRSQITKLTSSQDSTFQGVAVGGIAGGVGSNIQIHTVGYAPNSFYVQKQLYGPDGKILEGQFADLDGNGIVNSRDFYRFHSPAPRWTFGLSTSVSSWGFTLSAAARANIGQYVYNNVLTDQGYLARLYGSSGNLANVTQSAVDLGLEKQGSLIYSDYFVQKASFLRIDNVSLGYDLHRLIDRDLYVTATLENWGLFTPYKGIDPEIGTGIDNSIYPRARTFSLAVALKL